MHPSLLPIKFPPPTTYLWAKNEYLLKYNDVYEIKNIFPTYKGTFLLPVNLLVFVWMSHIYMRNFYLFFNAN